MERKNYTIAVDLGTSNVTVAVGELLDNGLLDVVYVARKPAEGVNAGQIENSQLAGNSIRAAIAEVEEALGCRITEVYAGISGEFVRCACHSDHVYVSNPHSGVNQSDVDSLFSRMRNVQAPEGETIMERIPQSYVIDGTQEVKNPVGSFGKTLSATFNFVLCNTTPLQRLEMVLKQHGIAIKGVFPSVLANPESVLSPDEKSEGVAVVDIGGGVTDVTVYYRNVVRYVATIPMGASAINQDIRTIGVPEKYIEQLKIEKGSAVAELAPNTLVKVPGRTPREEKGILKQNLASVIEARAMDIAEYVLQEIQDSRYGSKLAYGIVLTGASAVLKDLDTLFNRVTKMDVRVASPDSNITEESFQLLDNPAYATVTGLLLLGARKGPSSLIVERVPRRDGDSDQTAADPAANDPQPGTEPAKQDPAAQATEPAANGSTAAEKATNVQQPASGSENASAAAAAPKPTVPAATDRPEPVVPQGTAKPAPSVPEQPGPAAPETPAVPKTTPEPKPEPPGPPTPPAPPTPPTPPLNPTGPEEDPDENSEYETERSSNWTATIKKGIGSIFTGINKQWNKNSSDDIDPEI